MSRDSQHALLLPEGRAETVARIVRSTDLLGRQGFPTRRQSDSAISVPRSSQSSVSKSWLPPAARVVWGAETAATNPQRGYAIHTPLPLASRSEPFSKPTRDSPYPFGSPGSLTPSERPPQTPNIPPGLLHAALTHQAKVSLLRDKLLQVRAELNAERGKLNGVRRISKESLEAIDQSLDVHGHLADLPPPGLPFSELYETWRVNETIQQVQEEKVKEVESTSSGLEFKLISEEKLAQLAIRTLFLSLGVETSNIAQPQSLLSGSNRALSDTPSLLQQYFVRKGDISIYLERLQELQATYYEILERKEFLKERGDPEDSLPTVDVDFLATYEEQHRFLTAELERAEEDASQLEKKCQDAGYPIPFYDEPAFEQSASASSESGQAYYISPERVSTTMSSIPLAARALRVRRTSERTGRSEPVAQLSAAVARAPRPRRDVQSWLSTVSDEPGSPMLRSQSSREFGSGGEEPQSAVIGAPPRRTISGRRRSSFPLDPRPPVSEPHPNS